MAAFKLPRLKANLAIVNGQGKPLDYFLRFWNIEVAPRIEKQEADQNSLIQQIQDLQEAQALQLVQVQDIQNTQALQLALINQALELAGIAVGLSGGNSATDTILVSISPSAWVLGPEVTLTDVLDGDLSIPGSGFISLPTTTISEPNVAGEIRLVETTSGSDVVIGGPWNFEIYRAEPFNTIYIVNSEEIASFSFAGLASASVSYRLDARMVLGSVSSVNLKLYARRTT